MEVRALFSNGSPLCSSRLVHPEACAAIARRAREGDLSVPLRNRLVARVTSDIEAMPLVEPTPEVIRSAARLVVQHSLRAYDAVHLANAMWVRDHLDPDVRFVCADLPLASRATALGLAGLIPGA